MKKKETPQKISEEKREKSNHAPNSKPDHRKFRRVNVYLPEYLIDFVLSEYKSLSYGLRKLILVAISEKTWKRYTRSGGTKRP